MFKELWHLGGQYNTGLCSNTMNDLASQYPDYMWNNGLAESNYQYYYKFGALWGAL